ncbi:uncharacterized protein LOC144038197 [Vanacampus margaritifer]
MERQAAVHNSKFWKEVTGGKRDITWASAVLTDGPANTPTNKPKDPVWNIQDINLVNLQPVLQSAICSDALHLLLILSVRASKRWLSRNRAARLDFSRRKAGQQSHQTGPWIVLAAMT